MILGFDLESSQNRNRVQSLCSLRTGIVIEFKACTVSEPDSELCSSHGQSRNRNRVHRLDSLRTGIEKTGTGNLCLMAYLGVLPEEPLSSEPSGLHPLPCIGCGATNNKGENVTGDSSRAPRTPQAKGQHVAVVLHHQSEKVLQKKLNYLMVTKEYCTVFSERRWNFELYNSKILVFNTHSFTHFCYLV